MNELPLTEIDEKTQNLYECTYIPRHVNKGKSLISKQLKIILHFLLTRKVNSSMRQFFFSMISESKWKKTLLHTEKSTMMGIFYVVKPYKIPPPFLLYKIFAM